MEKDTSLMLLNSQVANFVAQLAIKLEELTEKPFIKLVAPFVEDKSILSQDFFNLIRLYARKNNLETADWKNTYIVPDLFLMDNFGAIGKFRALDYIDITKHFNRLSMEEFKKDSLTLENEEEIKKFLEPYARELRRIIPSLLSNIEEKIPLYKQIEYGKKLFPPLYYSRRCPYPPTIISMEKAQELINKPVYLKTDKGSVKQEVLFFPPRPEDFDFSTPELNIFDEIEQYAFISSHPSHPYVGIISLPKLDNNDHFPISICCFREDQMNTTKVTPTRSLYEFGELPKYKESRYRTKMVEKNTEIIPPKNREIFTDENRIDKLIAEGITVEKLEESKYNFYPYSIFDIKLISKEVGLPIITSKKIMIDNIINYLKTEDQY